MLNVCVLGSVQDIVWKDRRTEKMNKCLGRCNCISHEIQSEKQSHSVCCRVGMGYRTLTFTTMELLREMKMQ